MVSYPWLCCTGKPVRNRGHQKDLYCAGDDRVFEFIENVLSEVVELFPSPYIHIGGDEAPKDRWEACPKCQDRIGRGGLQNAGELQGYFVRRVADFLASKGRRIIGWEEILEGDIPQDAVVHWWIYRTRGAAGAINGARQGHQVIASPNSFCYLSFPVNPDEHFALLRTSDLPQVYAALYVPKGLSPQEQQNIIGAECCIWTEFLTPDQIDRKFFPRAFACAELMWSYPEERDFDEFFARVQSQSPRLEVQGIRYGPALRQPGALDERITGVG